MNPLLKKSKNYIKLCYKDLLKSPKEFSLHDKIHKSIGLNNDQGFLVIQNIPGLSDLRKKLFTSLFNLYKQPTERRKLATNTENFIGWVEVGSSSTENEASINSFAYMCRLPSHIRKLDEVDHTKKEYNYVFPSDTTYRENILNLNNFNSNISKLLIDHFNDYLNKELPNFNNMLINSYKNWNSNQRQVIYPPVPFNSKLLRDAYHSDVCFFTTVFYPIYLDKNLVENKDIKETCLFFKDSKGVEHQAEFEPDELVINTGDMFFFLSAGLIQTSYHCVKSVTEITKSHYRSNVVSFIEPLFSQKITIGGGLEFDEIKYRDSLKYFYKDNLKFRNGMTFGEYELNYVNSAVYK